LLYLSYITRSMIIEPYNNRIVQLWAIVYTDTWIKLIWRYLTSYLLVKGNVSIIGKFLGPNWVSQYLITICHPKYSVHAIYNCERRCYYILITLEWGLQLITKITPIQVQEVEWLLLKGPCGKDEKGVDNNTKTFFFVLTF